MLINLLLLLWMRFLVIDLFCLRLIMQKDNSDMFTNICISNRKKITHRKQPDTTILALNSFICWSECWFFSARTGIFASVCIIIIERILPFFFSRHPLPNQLVCSFMIPLAANRSVHFKMLPFIFVRFDKIKWWKSIFHRDFFYPTNTRAHIHIILHTRYVAIWWWQ